MKMAIHVVLWIFIGAIVVLIIKNAGNFAVAVSAVDQPVLGAANLLSGSGYQGGQNVMPSYGVKAA
jgi:membrane-bound inhibitor of C-type lysozyme